MNWLLSIPRRMLRHFISPLWNRFTGAIKWLYKKFRQLPKCLRFALPLVVYLGFVALVLAPSNHLMYLVYALAYTIGFVF